jgi:hypothetical protein
VLTRELHQRCTVAGCIRRPHHWGSGYCSKHAARANQYGHPQATTATIKELAQFADWIDYGLRIFRDTPAVRIALDRAQGLLHFQPDQGQHWERYLAGRMANVRLKPGVPVDARRMLLTALSFYAFEAAHPQRVMSDTVRNMGLARSLIRLGKCRHKPPRKSELNACGGYINDLLGMFAVKFLDELQKRTRKDNAQRDREEALLRDFSSPTTTMEETPK